MKKIIMIIGALMLSGGCLTAQYSPTQDTATHGYRSFFGSESTVWYYGEPLLTGGVFSYRVVIDGDTTINGLNYKRVHKYRLYEQDTNDIVGFEVDEDILILAREDTTTGKLWYKRGNNEVLIADLSLEEGDDFNGLQVLSIEYDSIMRKKIILGQYNSPEREFILEGVGPEFPFGYPNIMICVYHDGNNIYKKDLTDTYYGCPINKEKCRATCNPLGFGSAETTKPLLFPNPCHSFFEIELSEESQISMYDGLGHIILRKKVYSGKEIIDITSLAAGCYYLNIANSDIFSWYKIIKK